MSREGAPSGKVAQIDRGSMKRVLGVPDLFAIGYGDLGSSIYYALGITALYALGATPIALGLAGLVFICTALTYAEMTATFHESGGSASFARHAFNDLISFIAGWGLLLDYIVTIAISAFAVAPYLSYFFPLLRLPGIQIGFTLGLILILFVINLLGARQSTRISLVLAGSSILTQGIVIAIGAVWLFDVRDFHLARVEWAPTWADFWRGTAMAMVAYTGIESIAQLGAEAKKPSRTVPRAVLVTMCVLVTMYLGIAVVALSAVSPKELGTTYLMDPIAGIVAALPFGSQVLGPWIGILAAAILFVAANAGLVGASRLSFNMGEYYQLPTLFYRLHHKLRTPFVSLAFFACLAALVVLVSEGQMTFLADLYNFGAMLAFFFAHLSLIVMRVKKPDLKRPFRIPCNIRCRGYAIPVSAVVGALAAFCVWVLVVVTKPQGRYLGMSWMVFGLGMYFFYRRRQKMSAAGQLSIEKIKVPDFQPVVIRSILVPTRGGVQTETVQMACELAKMHGAAVTALNIIEVPYSLPLDAALIHRTASAEAVLRRAAAIARECGVSADTLLIRSRSIQDSILDLLRGGKYDLLVLGSGKEPAERGLSPIVETMIRKAPCRVWVCSS